MRLTYRTAIRVIVLFVCILFICPLQVFSSEDEERPLVHQLLMILRDTGKSARFEYTGPCDKTSPLVVPYPAISLSDSGEIGDAISRIRRLLRDNKDIVVEESDGLIVIKAFGVKEDAFDIPVNKFYFTPTERWNPDYALLTIWYKKPLKHPLAALRMEPENYLLAYFLTPPGSRDLPHLPVDISGPTMRTVVDNMRRQFWGLLIYGECKREDGSRLFGTQGYSVEYYEHFEGTASLGDR